MKRTRSRVAREQSSRARLRAARTRPPAFNPASPGQTGGRYRPLTESDCKRIYRAALQVLDEIGQPRGIGRDREASRV